jgi:hypothetical protein
MMRLAMTRLSEGGREVPVPMSLKEDVESSAEAGWTLESTSEVGAVVRWK